MTLVLEEIAGGKNEENFAGRSLLAAALASTVVLVVSGGAPSLPSQPTSTELARALDVASSCSDCGLAGLAFQYVTLAIRRQVQAVASCRNLEVVIRHTVGGAFSLLAFALTGRLGAFGLGEMIWSRRSTAALSGP